MDDGNANKSGVLQPLTLVPAVDAADFLDAMTCSCQGTLGQGSGGACGCGTVNGGGSS